MIIQVTCLAMAIYFESRGESASGQVAVAETVLNRVESTKYPNTVCEVVKQNKQFSFYSDGLSDKPTEKVAWQRSLNIADFMIKDRDYVTVVGKEATHFHADYVQPYWAASLHKIKKVGTHIFYRSDL